MTKQTKSVVKSFGAQIYSVVHRIVQSYSVVHRIVQSYSVVHRIVLSQCGHLAC